MATSYYSLMLWALIECNEQYLGHNSKTFLLNGIITYMTIRYSVLNNKAFTPISKGGTMKVIHDNELGGIAMIPLICDWGIPKTCQIRGCDKDTNAIVCFTKDEAPTGEPLRIGICEEHHQEAKAKDAFNYTVDI